jgi:hypothetical protein
MILAKAGREENIELVPLLSTRLGRGEGYGLRFSRLVVIVVVRLGDGHCIRLTYKMAKELYYC